MSLSSAAEMGYLLTQAFAHYDASSSDGMALDYLN